MMVENKRKSRFKGKEGEDGTKGMGRGLNLVGGASVKVRSNLSKDITNHKSVSKVLIS